MSGSTTAAALPDRVRRAARAALAELRPAAGSTTAQEPESTPAPVAPDPEPVAEGTGPEPVTAEHSPVLPLDLTAAVAAGPRLSGILAPEWRQRTLDRRTWRDDLDGADLLLLEGVGGSVPGWGDGSALADVITTAKGASVPVLLWVTDDTAPGAWSGEVTALGASSTRLAEELTAAGHTAHHWAPAAQPRTSGLAREDATTTRRSGALLVVDGLSRLGDDSSLRQLAEALGKMPKSQTRLVRRPGKASTVTLPPALAERSADGDIADASVLLDLSATSPAGAWTSVAAAAAQTPLVGTTDAADLPAEIDALVPRVSEPKDLRSELVARVNQEELVAREGLRLQRAVLAGHTGAHRARELAGAAGLTVPPTEPATISAVVPTNRTHELDNVFANLGRLHFQLQADQVGGHRAQQQVGVLGVIFIDIYTDQQLATAVLLNPHFLALPDHGKTGAGGFQLGAVFIFKDQAQGIGHCKVSLQGWRWNGYTEPNFRIWVNSSSAVRHSTSNCGSARSASPRRSR